MKPQLSDGTIVAISGQWVEVWRDGRIVEQEFFNNAADTARFAVETAERIGVDPVLILPVTLLNRGL